MYNQLDVPYMFSLLLLKENGSEPAPAPAHLIPEGNLKNRKKGKTFSLFLSRFTTFLWVRPLPHDLVHN